MRDIYTPAIRVFVVAGLFLATATLMFVAVNTARATGSRALSHFHSNNDQALFVARVERSATRD